MNNFFKLTRITFTIWVLAALINAVLSAILLKFTTHYIIFFPGTCLFVFGFSLLFSLPGIFIFWLVCMYYSGHERLFRILLQAGLITALISGLLFLYFLGNEFEQQSWLLALFALLAAVSSIMLHHRIIVSTCKNKMAETNV